MDLREGGKGGKVGSMRTDRHDRCKRQLHIWLRCDTYVKLQNLAKERGESATHLLTRLVEAETAQVQLTKQQEKEILRRIEGRPLMAFVKTVGEKLIEAKLPIHRPLKLPFPPREGKRGGR